MSDFWNKQLEKMIPVGDMPYERPDVIEYQQWKCQFTIKEQLSSKLIDICKQHDLLLYTMLLSVVQIILYKMTGQEDIVVLTPKYGVHNGGYLFLRNRKVSFDRYKKFLLEVRDQVAEVFRNQDSFEGAHDKEEIDIDQKAWYKVAFVYSNIQKDEELEELPYELKIKFTRMEGQIVGEFKSSTDAMDKVVADAFVKTYETVLEQIIHNLDTSLDDIELIDKEDRERFLQVFGKQQEGAADVCDSVPEMFKRTVKQYKHNTALLISQEMENVYSALESEEKDEAIYETIRNAVFIENPYMYQKHFVNKTEKDERAGYYLIRTNKNDCILVNGAVWELLRSFDGTRNVNDIFHMPSNRNKNLFLRPMNIEDAPGDNNRHAEDAYYFSYQVENGTWQMTCQEIVKILFRYNLIVCFTGKEKQKDTKYETYEFPEIDENGSFLFQFREGLSQKEVLLLGDSLGNSSVGMLYLASYLERHGIRACCDFTNNCWDKETLKYNVETLIRLVNPRILGVSMKWFPHMARVLEICRIAKACKPSLKIVLGGDTAAYFAAEIIKNEEIDYVIRGDGEEPLLDICLGKEEIKNSVYYKEDKICENSISYIQGEWNSADMQLVDLEDILVCKQSSLLSNFYLSFYKGCNMSCIYCGGRSEIQNKNFHRSHVFIRKEEVRNDLLKVIDYTSVFILDLDIPFSNLESYLKKIFEGINLSSHMAIVFSLYPLPNEIINLLCKIFRYVRFNLDMVSLSQRHRKELEKKRMVKPQPLDKDIIAFFESCEQYDNLNVDINLISGLPFMTSEDIKSSEEMYDYLIQHFSLFSDLHWGRLHAQPGTPLSLNAEEFQMVSMAKEYEDYLKFSQMNLESDIYPSLQNLNYPYIYYKDTQMNIDTSKFYMETLKKSEKRTKLGRCKKVGFYSYTYDKIDTLSDNVSSMLIAKGKDENTVVALLTDHPLFTVIGILGIIKAGKAYLPIDKTLPEERIKHIIEESKPELILTESKEELEKHNLLGYPFIEIEESMQYKETCISLRIPDLEDTICVIYTSGSTGTPEGVKVTQRGMVNYLKWRLHTYQYTEHDVTLSLLPYSFDGFGSNFYSGILSGGTLVMLPENLRRNYIHAKDVIREAEVSNVSVATSLYKVLLEYLQACDMKSLRFVVLGGEKIDKELVMESQKKAGNLKLISEYGLTECTITSTANLNVKKDSIKSIGKTINNTQVYIVNKERKLMPIGIKGEICISGIGLSKGYVKDDGIKSKRFINNPFDQDSKLYCTGDYGRWLQDGNIEFLGRKDDQVKIGGCRVDMHEIERQLLQYEGIKQAVVVADKRQTDKVHVNTYLYAYFVADEIPDILDIRSKLEKKLPEYMIPSLFFQIQEIPLTNNGKTDCRKLLEMAAQIKREPEIEEDNVSEVEKVIMDIWKTVLNRSDVSKQDTFFKVGGNSLLLMQVHAKIEKIYPSVTKITDLFAYPTIESIAKFIKEKTNDTNITTGM